MRAPLLSYLHIKIVDFTLEGSHLADVGCGSKRAVEGACDLTLVILLLKDQFAGLRVEVLDL